MLLQDSSGITKEKVIENYFRKIGYTGDREVSLHNLREIHLLHPAAIPFENLSPILQEPVLLDLESVYNKLVLGDRGGYCFEQNLLLGYVLESMGYNVRGIMARTLYNLPEGRNLFRGHMALLVELHDVKYLVDVGFGGLTLSGPLLFDTTAEQSTPHEKFRLLPDEDEYIVEAQVKEEWKPLYMVSLHRTILSDYELASWYHCKHPHSRFTKRLVVAKTTADARYALLNNQLSVHHKNGETEKHLIAGGEELIKILAEVFNIQIEDKKILTETFERLGESKV